MKRARNAGSAFARWWRTSVRPTLRIFLRHSAVRRQSALGAASPKPPPIVPRATPKDTEIAALASDLDKLIVASKQQVVTAVNAALTTLYWQVGHRVMSMLQGRRAEYGAHMIAELGRRMRDARAMIA